MIASLRSSLRYSVIVHLIKSHPNQQNHTCELTGTQAALAACGNLWSFAAPVCTELPLRASILAVDGVDWQRSVRLQALPLMWELRVVLTSMAQSAPDLHVASGSLMHSCIETSLQPAFSLWLASGIRLSLADPAVSPAKRMN